MAESFSWNKGTNAMVIRSRKISYFELFQRLNNSRVAFFIEISMALNFGMSHSAITSTAKTVNLILLAY